MTHKTHLILRQGDVLVLRIEDIDADLLKPATKDPRGLVLADGESSGHHHQVFGRGSKLFAFRDTARQERVLHVGRAGAELRVVGGESGGVARHLPISVPGGKYLVRVQRTWTAGDEAKSRAVAD